MGKGETDIVESSAAIWESYACLLGKIEAASELPRAHRRTYFPEECYDLASVRRTWSDL